MHLPGIRLGAAMPLLALALAAGTAHARDDDRRNRHRAAERPASVQLGPRPFFLVDDMREGPLKRQLQQCAQTRQQ